jgi:hypothetical protein
MTGGTICSNRFLNTHFPVAFHTLPVIGSHQSRFERIFLVEGPAMAIAAFGRILGCRTVVMATLAEGALLTMKIFGQFVIFNILEQRIYNFAVR